MHRVLDGFECFWLGKVFDWTCTDEGGELFVVAGELVDGKEQNTTVNLGSIRRLLHAFLEFDVLVPEGVALEVKTDKVSSSLEKPRKSVSLGEVQRGREERGGG
jgi:hypothetical protein